MNKKKPHANKQGKSNKVATIKDNPYKYYDTKPSWRFYRSDTDHTKWAVTEDKIEKNLLSKIRNLESMCWKDILTAVGGRKKGTNNHLG